MVRKIIVFVATFCAFYGFSQEWVQTGNLNYARCDHSAILLQNGKVLVTGGMGAYNSCELYDPGSGIWKETGNLNQERWSHAAVLLGDGRVLVIGGCGPEGLQPLRSCELYNPSTGKWSFTDSLYEKRAYPTVAVLNNGKVLVVGGLGENFHNPPECEIWSPSTEKWKLTENLTPGRCDNSLCVLEDGKVLTVGGRTTGKYANCQLYNPETGEWSTTGQLNYVRGYGPTTTLLKNGKVLVVGGQQFAPPVSPCELYELSTETWQITDSISPGRYSHRVVLLQDGKVLVVDGFAVGAGQFLSDCEIYDPTTGNFEDAPQLVPARENHTATLLQDGRVLVAGGWAPDLLADCKLFVPLGVDEQISKVDDTDFFVSPNPFTNLAYISFSLSRMDWVELSVYDIAGRTVKTLVNGLLEPEVYKIEWNGDDDSGAAMPTGFYIIRLNMKGSIRSKGLVFVK